MNTNIDRLSATTAAVARLNDQASVPTAGEHDVQGFGGLSGGVVGSVTGIPGAGSREFRAGVLPRPVFNPGEDLPIFRALQ